MKNNYVNVEYILGNGKVKAETHNGNTTGENNDDRYIISLNDNDEEEIDYTVNFKEDIIEISGTEQKYNEDIFLSVIANRGNLINLNEFMGLFVNQSRNYDFDSARITYESNILNKIFSKSGDEYLTSFISYINRNNLMNENNYFLFLKLACEGGNQEIFDYLRLEYENYFHDLNEEQKLILTGSVCFGGNPIIIHELEDLKFPFGLNALKGAICGEQFEVFKYLVVNNYVDINVKNRKGETILSYLIKNDKTITDRPNVFDEIFSNHGNNTKEINDFLFKKSNIKDLEEKKINDLIENLTKKEWDKLYNAKINELTEEDIKHLNEIKINLGDENNKKFIADLIKKIELGIKKAFDLTEEKIKASVAEEVKKFIKKTIKNLKNEDKKFTALKYLSLFWSELNINEKDSDGKTIFYTAVENGNIELCKLLISDPRIATSINEKDNDGKAPIHIAIENGNVELVKVIFFELKAQQQIKEPAINTQNLEILNGFDGSYDTPISVAIERGNPEIIKFFISVLSDEEIKEFFFGEFDLFQENPISSAAKNPNPEIIETLLSRLSEQDKKLILNRGVEGNNTAIYVAAECKNSEVVKFLLKQVCLNLKDKDIDLINRNFSDNEEIKKLLIARNKNIESANIAIDNMEMLNDIVILSNGTDDIVSHDKKDKQIQKE